MEKILRSITEREVVLDRGITEAERDADRLPAGKLRVSTSRKQRAGFIVLLSRPMKRKGNPQMIIDNITIS